MSEIVVSEIAFLYYAVVFDFPRC